MSKDILFGTTQCEMSSINTEPETARRTNMPVGAIQEALRLTEDEAFAILSLCLTSPQRLDSTSERALKKLADYCSSHGLAANSNHINTEQVERRVG